MTVSAHQPEKELPEDLPVDMMASYKPRSMRAPAAEDAIPSSMDKPLSRWSVRVSPAEEKDLLARPEPTSVEEQLEREFVLHKVIGRGGFGEVWEATQASLGRVIAVKRLREDFFQSRPLRESMARDVEKSFRQEAFTAANLDHPNIVPVYDLGIDGAGHTLLAMKKVRGRSWEEVLEEDRAKLGDLEYLQRHIPILIQVSQAVSFAHSRGVVHRDLKPSQVMIGEFGEVLLMDWGLAVVFNPDRLKEHAGLAAVDETAPTVDSAPNPAGTIAFMAPEQTEKTCARIGPWTDLYLLGGTLYFLLTNTVPHRAPGNVAAFYKAMRGEVDDPSVRAPDRDIPEELRTLCQRAMHPLIEERLQCAKAFIEGLQGYLAGATRRAEAQRLVAEARTQLAKATPRYEDFGRALTMLERARGLYEKIPGAAALAQDTVTRFARLALANNDLILARAQLVRIEDEATRATVARDVDRAEKEAASATYQRRVFRWTAILFLALLIGGGIKYAMDAETARQRFKASNLTLKARTREAEAARRESEAARAESDAARQRAEALVTFLVDDFTHDLKSLGRIDVFEKLAQQLIAYYEARPEDDSPLALANEARALRLVAGVRLAQGRVEECSEILTKARAAAQALLDLDRRHSDTIAIWCQTEMTVAELAVFRAQWDEVISAVARIRPFAAELVKRDADNPEWAYIDGNTMFLRSFALYQQGEFDTALYEFSAASSRIEVSATRHPDNRQLQFALAAIYDARSVIHELNDQMDEAIQMQLRILEIRQAAVRDEPWNTANHDSIGAALLSLGRLSLDLGEAENARYYLTQARETFDRLAMLDPALIMRRLPQATARLGLAQLAVDEAMESDAFRHLDEAAAFLGELEALDATNLDAATLSIRSLIIRGDAIASVSPDDAAAFYEEANSRVDALALKQNVTGIEQLVLHAQALLRLRCFEDVVPVLRELQLRRVRCPDVFRLAHFHGLVKMPRVAYTIELEDAVP